ncbi:hypothetical protein CPZ21_00395 [Staphylococcus epidermidis]|nr:hypothetical protein CPZ21_00395 [Staphylococcus epidermidis]
MLNHIHPLILNTLINIIISYNLIFYNYTNHMSILKSSPDSCVKCYTMFLPFLLIKIDVFS